MSEAAIERRRPGMAQGITLLAAGWLMPLALGILTPALPAMARAFSGIGDGAFLTGLIATAPAFAAALSAPAAGWAVDRIGARQLLFAGLAGFALLGSAPYWIASPQIILAFRFALGLAMTAAVVASTAMIAGYFDGAARDRWLAMQSATTNLAGIAAAAIGGLVATQGWREPFLVHAAPLLLLAIALITLPRRRAASAAGAAPSSTAAPLDWRGLAPLLILTVFSTVVMFAAVLQTSFLLASLGIEDPALIGFAISLVSVGAVVGSLLVGAMTRLGVAQRLTAAFGLSAAGLVAMALSGSYGMAIAGGAFAAAGIGISLPTLVSEAVGSAAPAARGRVSGLWMSAVFLGQFLNPPIFAFLNAWTGGVAASMAALGVLSTAVTGLVLLRAPRPRG